MKTRVFVLLTVGLLLLGVGCQSAGDEAPIPAATLAPVEATVVVSTPAGQASPTVAATDAPQAAVTTEMPEDAVAEEPQAPAPGLPIEAYFEESFGRLLARDPELLVELGLEELDDPAQARLTPISTAYREETTALQKAILEELHTYDREALTPEQQVSYDVYAWYLADQIEGQQYDLYRYPAAHFLTTSAQSQLAFFFTDIQPVTDAAEAQAYVARLWQVDEKIDELIVEVEQRAEAGIVPPRFTVQWALRDLPGLTGVNAATSPFYTTLEEKLDGLENVSPGEKDALLADASAAVETEIILAYRRLGESLTALEAQAPVEAGLGQYPGGAEAYAYLLRHYTTTDLTAEEIHALGLQELERIHADMRAIFAELGYPASDSLQRAYGRVTQETGVLYGEEAVQAFETLLEEAAVRMEPAFISLPEAELRVIGVDSGGFYVGASLDGSRPGAFYATVTGGQPTYNMASLAYHEGVPGHHLQIALAQEMDLPLFRNVITFNGYTEGWALYAERLAKELGWYADDPYGDLGRLQFEAYRAARLVVDTGIHAQGWSYNEAADFFAENTGFSDGYAQWEAARYVVWPGQATAYMTGMLEFLRLRELAQAELGEAFALPAFHETVLSEGALPLGILERVVEEWVREE